MTMETGTTTCATCGSPMAAGAPFCTACGASAASIPTKIASVPSSGPEHVQPVRAALMPSPIGRRFGAYVIDTIWTGLLSGIVDFVVAFALVRAAITTNYSQYTATMQFIQFLPAITGLVIGLILVASVGSGGTPGMRLVGIRVVRFDDGAAPGFGKALGRQLVLVLSGFIIVGPFSPLFDRSGANRGWHDTASGTWVVLRPGTGAPQDLRPAVARSTPPAPAPEARREPVPAPPTTPIERPAAPIAPVAAAPIIPPPALPAPSGVAPVVEAFVPPSPPRATPSHRATDGLVTGVPGVVHAAPPEEDRTLLRSGGGAAYRLRFAAGDEELDGSALIGRDPAPRPGEVVDRLIHPSDAVRSMSKTHARVDIDADGVWITDRGSTNGTRTTGPDGWTELTPNVRTRIVEGTEIEFGSVRATVVR